MAGKACAVRQLLNEFQHFMSPVTFYEGMTTGKCMRQYQAWKKGRVWDLTDEDGRLKSGWPFWYPLQQYRLEWFPHHENSKEDTQWLNYELDLMQSRFERKQRRKQRKLEHKDGLWKQCSMPGTWVKDVYL